jgi:hypothetical protein
MVLAVGVEVFNIPTIVLEDGKGPDCVFAGVGEIQHRLAVEAN